MRRKRLYIILLIGLLFCVWVKNRNQFASEKVEERSGAASLDKEWYPLISEEINRREIGLRVDGREIQTGRTPVVMSDTGEFMIPSGLFPEAFSCAAHLYNNSKLLIEKHGVKAEMLLGAKSVTTGGMEIPLKEALKKEADIIYVPLEAVEKVFSYQKEWKVEENRLELTSAGGLQRTLPYAYDSRDAQRAPVVKNQGTLGTCWAFASLMALESRLLPNERFSFSEDHMSIRNSFHMSQNDGGEYTMSMAYLLAWQGPVLEKDDVYGDSYSPPGLKPVKHVQEIQILPSKDYDAIKEAVYFYGGVQSSLYTSMVSGEGNSQFYNKEKGAYCYIGTDKPNHDVVIIGWDDNYPKENFSLDLEGNGAFICANSWGGEFGDEGYFYVSYYDTNIGIHNILYTRVEGTANYDQIYQTDLCGWIGQLGYGKEEAYFANIYEAREEEELWAVGFYATGPDTSYQVYTVSDAENTNRFGRRALVAKGSFKNSGYYTVDFKKPVKLKKGERFAVIVSILTPGSVHPVAIEYRAPDKKARVDLEDGEGYISYRGTSWERVEDKQSCNVCLKAYTRKEDASSEMEPNREEAEEDEG